MHALIGRSGCVGHGRNPARAVIDDYARSQAASVERSPCCQPTKVNKIHNGCCARTFLTSISGTRLASAGRCLTAALLPVLAPRGRRRAVPTKIVDQLTILPGVRHYARLLSPLPRDEVRRRIAAAARSGYASGNAVTLREDSIPLVKSGPIPWKLRAWNRAYLDQGVRARFVTDNEVVLEPYTYDLRRLSVDACRVRLGPARRTTKQEPPPTALICEPTSMNGIVNGLMPVEAAMKTCVSPEPSSMKT